MVKISRARLVFVESVVEGLKSGQVVALLAFPELSIDEVTFVDSRKVEEYKRQYPKWKDVTSQMLEAAPDELRILRREAL